MLQKIKILDISFVDFTGGILKMEGVVENNTNKLKQSFGNKMILCDNNKFEIVCINVSDCTETIAKMKECNNLLELMAS